MKKLESVYMVSVISVGDENIFIVRDKTTNITSTLSNPEELGDELLKQHNTPVDV